MIAYTLAAATLLAAAAYFAVRWLQLRRGYESMSVVERRYVEINALRDRQDKLTVKARASREAARLGLGDGVAPLVLIFAFLYLTALVSMRLLGVPDLINAAAGLPACAAMAYGYVSFSARRRRSEFNAQLVDMLDMLVAQIKAGVGAERAMITVAPQLPDPIREELIRTLAKGHASKDVLGELRELATRYPSRAFDMFLAALEINQAEGQPIADALEQASALLKADFALAREARAEVAQVKYEFLFVAGVIGAIAAYMIFAGPESSRSAYASVTGLIVLALSAANVGLGFFRFFRTLNKLKGDT